MAEGLFGGAFFGNPNIQRQGVRARALAQQRDVNTLPDPRTYAVASGLFGTAPDQMGFSVLNPQYEAIQRAARPAFALGTALGLAPALAPLTKGLPIGMGIKDVGKLDALTGLTVNPSGLKTIDTVVGKGVPINVMSNPDQKDMKFFIDDFGQANLEINPIFANDMSYVKDRHFRAVDDFLWPFGDDVYVRGANTKADYDYLKSKTHRGSKNYATNEEEGGLSVGRGVEATMFPYAYLVKGKKIGSGSDSEPLLDLASAEPFGKVMNQKQMQLFLQKEQDKKLKSLGIQENQIRALKSVPVLKNIDEISKRNAAIAAAMGVAAPNLLAAPMVYTDPFANTIDDTTR